MNRLRKGIIVGMLSLTLSLGMLISDGSIAAADDGKEKVEDAEGTKGLNGISLERPEMNETSLKAFFDKLLPSQLKDGNMAGVVVSVVMDDKIQFVESYGTKDAAAGASFDLDTMTRIGSITKVFMWQSLLKLASEGKIDLDAPIETYAKGLSIENPFDKPVTLRHLMTHTAGFEDELSTLFVGGEDSTKTLLEDYRRVIYEPGTTIAYSNYGAGIGGYIVESVSGMSLQDYISQNIYEPLGMSRSTLLEPAREYYDNVSYGHAYANKQYYSYEDPGICYQGAGSMSTTAVDMANYMIMHLNKGNFEGRQIIDEAYLAKMHQVQVTSDDSMPGITLGMMEWKRNNVNMVWHSGGNETFKSMLLLLPDEDVGLFISYNTKHAEPYRNHVRDAFLDTFYPIEIEQVQPMEGYKERTAMYVGTYKEGRGSTTNSDKLIYMISRGESLEDNGDGTITFRDTTYYEVEPGVFREVGGQAQMRFDFDNKGNPAVLYQDYEPHEVYLKLDFWELPTTSGLIFLLLIIGLIALMILTKMLATHDWITGHGSDKYTMIIRYASILVLLYPMVSLGYLGSQMALDPMVLTKPEKLDIYRGMLAIPVFATLMTVIGGFGFSMNSLKGAYHGRQKWLLGAEIVMQLMLYGFYIWMRLYGVYSA